MMDFEMIFLTKCNKITIHNLVRLIQSKCARITNLVSAKTKKHHKPASPPASSKSSNNLLASLCGVLSKLAPVFTKSCPSF